MVMIINKKIRRTMMENKAPYLGSIVLIIFSSLLFIMMNLLADNMTTAVSSFAQNQVQEDASFITNTKLTNIHALETKFNARIEEGATFDFALSESKTLRVFSENTKVNIPAIIKGENLKKGGILLDPAYAKANNLQVGSTLKILDKNFTVRGYTALPNYIYILRSDSDILSDPNSFGIAVMSKEDFAGFNRGATFYAIKFNHHTDSVISLAEQSERFRDYLRKNTITVGEWKDISENTRVTYVTTKIEGISSVSTIMPTAILLLTCILTGMVIWRLLQREAVIIGTLYAQGYRKREIRRHYLRYPITIASIGGIIGTGLGMLTLRPMLDFMLLYFNIPITSLRYDPVTILAGVFLPVLLLGLSGYLILDRELRYSPVELMRGGRKEKQENFIERNLNLVRYRFATRFKLRQQLRSLSRLIFLLFGVILATMLLLMGFAAQSSLDYLLKDNLNNTYHFQYEYVYNSLHEEQIPAGTEAFAASSFIAGSETKNSFTICGIDSNSKLIELKDKSGNRLATNRIIITKPLADKLRIIPGDTVSVTNKLNSQTYSITVDQIADTYIGEYIFMPLSEFNQILGLPLSSYTGLWSTEKLDIPESQRYSAKSIEDTIKAFNASLDPIKSAIAVIALISFIIGLVVIYVVTSLIIEENRETISLMKIFGYRKREINALILNSSGLFVIIGYILGIPLLLASMTVMFKSLTESINLALPIKISFVYIVIGFVIICLTYEISKAFSRKKIDRITMSESLKTVRE